MHFLTRAFFLPFGLRQHNYFSILPIFCQYSICRCSENGPKPRNKDKKRSLSASMDSYGGDGGILKISEICGFFRVFSPFSALFMTVFTSILYKLPIFCQYFCNKKEGGISPPKGKDQTMSHLLFLYLSTSSYNACISTTWFPVNS